MPFYEQCLECGNGYKLSPYFWSAFPENHRDNYRHKEHCIICGRTTEHYRYFLGVERTPDFPLLDRPPSHEEVQELLARTADIE